MYHFLADRIRSCLDYTFSSYSCFFLVLSRAANQDKLLIPRMELETEVPLATSIINKRGLPSAAGHLSLCVTDMLPCIPN